MSIIPSILALCVVFLTCVDSRVILVQDTPITSEGVSLRIALKEDRDASGHPVATVRLIIEDEKKPTSPPVANAEQHPRYPIVDNSIIPSNEIIPNFDDRTGIRYGQCPIGYVWRGVKCVVQGG